MNQRIDGDRNIQAGRDVYIQDRMFLDAANANLMPCPACRRPVSPGADECPDCGDNLLRRRQIAWEQARQARINQMVGYLVLIAAASYGVGHLFDGVRTPATIITVIAGLFAAGLFNQK